MGTIGLGAFVVFAVLGLSACGGGKCTAGASSACTCTNGASGAQVCDANGTFSTCQCSGQGTDAGSCPSDPTNSATLTLTDPPATGTNTVFIDGASVGTTGGGGCSVPTTGSLDVAFQMDSANNFFMMDNGRTVTTTTSCNGVVYDAGTVLHQSIHDVGTVCGLGAVNTSAGAGASGSTAAIAGHGYVFSTVDGKLHTMFVLQIVPNTSGGVYGPQVQIAP